MKQFTRRTVLRCSGMEAASLALQSKRIAWTQSALSAPLATTTAGTVSGFLANGVNVFKGIPYGGDTEKTRFKAPGPPEPWSGVKECIRFASMAPQLTIARVSSGAAPRVARDQSVQNEDCLHLNVWTAGLRDHKKRPVLATFMAAHITMEP